MQHVTIIKGDGSKVDLYGIEAELYNDIIEAGREVYSKRCSAARKARWQSRQAAKMQLRRAMLAALKG